MMRIRRTYSLTNINTVALWLALFAPHYHDCLLIICNLLAWLERAREHIIGQSISTLLSIKEINHIMHFVKALLDMRHKTQSYEISEQANIQNEYSNWFICSSNLLTIVPVLFWEIKIGNSNDRPEPRWAWLWDVPSIHKMLQFGNQCLDAKLCKGLLHLIFLDLCDFWLLTG